MTNHCDFNTNLECGCDHKCRVKVDVPLIKPRTKGLMVVMLASCLVMVLGLAGMEAANRSHVQDLRNQESSIKW